MISRLLVNSLTLCWQVCKARVCMHVYMSTRLSFSCMVGFYFELHVSVSVVYSAHGYAYAVSSDQGHCRPSLPLLWKGATIMVTATANCLYIISVNNCKGLYDIILYHPHHTHLHTLTLYIELLSMIEQCVGTCATLAELLVFHINYMYVLRRPICFEGYRVVVVWQCCPVSLALAGPLAHCVYKLAAAPQTTAGSAIYYTIL